MRPNITKIVLATIAMIMLSQTGAATWYAHGTFEPDNSLDDSAYMWTDAPGVERTRVYFNAYTGSAAGLRATMISPNVGLLESTNEAPTLEYHMAILGVWVDCNGDGYVGIAETAAQEYPAAMLLNTTICPGVIGDDDVWTAGAHNYNGWVSEYVPIGGKSDVGDNGNDSRVYIDEEAMVWGDNGRPDDAATAGGSCALAPMPRGTFQSTGGFVNWLECNSALLERWNDAFQGRRFAGSDVPGLYDLGVPETGLTFRDDDNASGTWIDHPTFGSENTQYSAVDLADCSQPNLLRVGDIINTTAPAPVAALLGPAVHNAHVPTLDPRTGNLEDATAPATLNRTQEDFLENCNTSDDDGHDFYGNNYVFYVGETDFNSVSTANKRAASWNLAFVDISRDPTITNLPAEQGTTPGSPIFGGRAGMAFPAPQSTTWNSPSVTVKGGPRLLRTDLNEATAEIDRPTNFTFYAHVGSATVARSFALPGGSGVYASAQCGDNDEGIHNGFNCDTKTWYRNPDGSPVPEPNPFARPGQKYELRDTDCYDGRTSLGIPLGLTAHGSAACRAYGE